MEHAGSYGQYELLRSFARGQVTEVFLAREKGRVGPESLVVVHRVVGSATKNRAFTERFLDEAGIAGTLKHPNIVEIHDLGELEDQVFLVQEYVPGGTLLELLERLGDRRVPLDAALHVVSEVCAGLQFAHALADPEGASRNLVHGAVNPRHVMVSLDGGVKVADFGMGAALAVLGALPEGDQKGREAYLAPEQVEGAEVDRRADVYACGAMLYRLATGALPGSHLDGTLTDPRKGEPELFDVPAVPDEIAEVILGAMARSPKERFPTCGALRREIGEVARKLGLAGDRAGLAKLVAAQFPEISGWLDTYGAEPSSIEVDMGSWETIDGAPAGSDLGSDDDEPVAADVAGDADVTGQLDAAGDADATGQLDAAGDADVTGQRDAADDADVTGSYERSEPPRAMVARNLARDTLPIFPVPTKASGGGTVEPEIASGKSDEAAREPRDEELDEEALPELHESELELQESDADTSNEFDALRTERLSGIDSEQVDEILREHQAKHPPPPSPPRRYGLWILVAALLGVGLVVVAVVAVAAVLFLAPMPSLEGVAGELAVLGERLAVPTTVPSTAGSASPRSLPKPTGTEPLSPAPAVQPSPELPSGVTPAVQAPPGQLAGGAMGPSGQTETGEGRSPSKTVEVAEGRSLAKTTDESRSSSKTVEAAPPEGLSKTVEAAPPESPPETSEQPGGPASPDAAQPNEPPRQPARPSAPSKRSARPREDGYLYVLTRPVSKVYMDNRMLGMTPLMKRAVSPGRHTLYLICDGFPSKRMSVDVAPGKVVQVRHLFGQ